MSELEEKQEKEIHYLKVQLEDAKIESGKRGLKIDELESKIEDKNYALEEIKSMAELNLA